MPTRNLDSHWVSSVIVYGSTHTHTMKTRWLPILSAIASLALSSCFQSESTIHLNKDGSGKLVQEIRLGAQALAMMSGFGGGQQGAAPDPVARLLSEDKAKADAAKLGEGVTFEKAEAVNVNGSKGARITYRFTDINKLRLTMNDNMEKMAPDAGARAADPGDTNHPLAFTYADGRLTVKMPEPKMEEGAENRPKPEPASDPAAEEMMKQLLSDMKMSMRLVIEPGIADTDASHREGNTITLMEMDLQKLVGNPEQLKKITSVDQKDPAAAIAALKGIDGIKFETKPQISVTLK